MYRLSWDGLDRIGLGGSLSERIFLDVYHEGGICSRGIKPGVSLECFGG